MSNTTNSDNCINDDDNTSNDNTNNTSAEITDEILQSTLKETHEVLKLLITYVNSQARTMLQVFTITYALHMHTRKVLQANGATDALITDVENRVRSLL